MRLRECAIRWPTLGAITDSAFKITGAPFGWVIRASWSSMNATRFGRRTWMG